MMTKQKLFQGNKISLSNPDIDYSAPLEQFINPDLIGAHPYTATLQHQFNKSNNMINNNNNNNQFITQQLLLTQLQQVQIQAHAQQQSNCINIGARTNLQPELYLKQEQAKFKQKKMSSLPKSNENKLESNLIKMWQQEQQQPQQEQIQSTIKVSQMLKDLSIDSETKTNIKNKNANEKNSINHFQLLAIDQDVKNVQKQQWQQQQQQTSKMFENNNVKNIETLNSWNSSFGTSSQLSTTSSFSSNCSSSSSCSFSTSSGCSSVGSSSLSPTVSATSIITPTEHNIRIGASHTIKDGGKESLWQQQSTQQLSKNLTTSNKLRELTANGNNYRNINAIQQDTSKNDNIDYGNLWSIGDETQYSFNTNNNHNVFSNNSISNSTENNSNNSNYETLLKYSKISNIWQMPLIFNTNNENINKKLYTDLWENIDNVCDKKSTVDSSPLVDSAGVWRLKDSDFNN